jgi:hypothetical protein
LAFSGDCVVDFIVYFYVNQFINFVFLGETFGDFFLMFPSSSGNIVGNSSIESAVFLVGKDVDVVGFGHWVLSLVKLLFTIFVTLTPDYPLSRCHSGARFC